MSYYNFDVAFQAGKYTVQIDTKGQYGYFEHNDLGDESAGGLWLSDRSLTDYDGVFELPEAVVVGLREHGFTVDNEFEPDVMEYRRNKAAMASPG